MNTFGKLFRVTTFGESHGPAIGGVIDGVPPRFRLDIAAVQMQLDRRRPGGHTPGATTRSEIDCVQFLSGLKEGVTTGAPIGFIITNDNARSADYDWLRHAFRPSHADYTYQAKYGIRSYAGGGRASARETACRVVAGAVALQLLESKGIAISSRISAIGPVSDPTPEQIEAEIMHARELADTVGGVIECTVTGVPAGLGEPLADKLSASLAAAMMSIPAAKGFEIGMGFDGCRRLGSETIDEFSDGFTTRTNHSGGIQGGISTGAPIVCRVAFKPVATLMRTVTGSDDAGHAIALSPHGRHDSCVLPRALPVVESMAAITLMDAMLFRVMNNFV
ncbi:MAG: chorismate synthase [Muribaculaceae bacterium]|nr:chorismate synthase [Muribaculaceae bacterium]